MTSLVTPEQRAATLLKTHLMQVRKALEPFPGELVICREDVLDSRFKVGPYRRINLQMHMVPSTYPKAGVVLDLSSPTVAPGVLKQLHTKCETLVKNAEGVDNVLLGVINFIKGTVAENKLLCCIHEIRKAKRTLGGALADLKMNEKSGHVRMKFVEGKYSSTLDFMVPDRYPHGGVMRMCIAPFVHFCCLFRLLTLLTMMCTNRWRPGSPYWPTKGWQGNVIINLM